MKDKLQVKRKRIKWAEFIASDRKLSHEFLCWRLKNKYKIRSLNRLGYIFLKSNYGMEYIEYIRKYNVYSFSDLVRIAKTPWIKKFDED